MALLWRKEQQIINKVKSYLEEISVCRDKFKICMQQLIQNGVNPQNPDLVEKVHQAESRADDIRREIELDLYQRALIPESRGDVLGLLETLDDIPGIFQSLCYQMSSQKIEVPKEFQNRFFEILEINIEAYDLLGDAIIGFFYKKDVSRNIQRIDERESSSDRMERALITGIFDSSMDKADKILLKEIVVNIGDISDQVEVVSDRLTLAIVKRRI